MKGVSLCGHTRSDITGETIEETKVDEINPLMVITIDASQTL
jgi:hypothetical protein